MNEDFSVYSESSLRRDMSAIRNNWKWLLASGIAFLVFGIIALSYSVLVTIASVLLFGWLLVFGGLFQAVHAFKIKGWSGLILEWLISVLYVIVGGMMVVNPGAGAASLTLLMAAFFLVGGVFRIVAAATLRPHRWGWLVASGLVTVLLGVLIGMEWPLSALWVIGLFIGIDMVMSGTRLIMLAWAARKFSSLKDGAHAAVSADGAENRHPLSKAG